MMVAPLWEISARQWREHRLRMSITTLSIALGVGVFFAVGSANRALLDSLALTVERLAGKSTLEVTSGESGFPEQILDTVRGTPGVQLAEPVIEVVLHTAFQDEGNLLVLGIDTTGDQQLRQYEFDRAQSEIADPLVYLAQPNSILLSRPFADRHGLRIGDSVPLFTAHGKKDFVVQGLFKPTGVGEVFGGNIAVMDIYSAQVVFDRGRNFDRIDLVNSPGTPVDDLERRLRARLPAGIDPVRPEVRGRELENAVTAMRLGMLITSFTALLVGVYIILNSFTISVNQRWKEIGILRALGVERGTIEAMFLCEALLIGVFASLAGIGGGFALAAATSRMMASIAASVYGVVSTAVAPRFQPGLALASLGLGVAASLLGAWFPARASSHLDPILALHNIESRGRESRLEWKRLAVGLALVFSCAALVQFSPSRVGLSIELSYIVLTLAGLTILLPFLVAGAAHLLRRAMDWAGGAEGALAVDAMIQSPRRSSATVGALMIGLMFVFSTGAYIQSYKHMINRWTDRLLNADLFVATSDLLRSTSYHFSEDVGRSIAALPEVRSVQNVRFTFIPFQQDSAALISIEMDGFLARAADAVKGVSRRQLMAMLPRGQGVLVSRNFSARWRLGVGDRVRLSAPAGPLDLPILGVVEDYRSDKGTIFVDRALYERCWNDHAVDFVDVMLRPGQDASAVKHRIEALTAGSEHAIVYTNAEFRHWIGSLVDQFFLLNYVQLAVAVIVAIVGIVNTLLVSVAERRREFGIIRAIGAYRRQIRKMVLLEAVGISLVGVAAGAVAALFNIQYMSHTESTVIAGYDVPFVFPWALIVASVPAVIALSLLAAWLPAHRAMRIQEIEAIGYE